MQFYKVEVTLQDDDTSVSGPQKRLEKREMGKRISSRCEKYSEKIEEGGYFFLSRADGESYTLGIITCEPFDIEKYVSSFLKQEKIKGKNFEIKETTFSNIRSMLSEAERNDFIFDSYDILQEYKLNDLDTHRRSVITYDERMIISREKKTIYKAADKYFARDSLQPELNRIFMSEVKKRPTGHPVDYLIESDDDGTKEGIGSVLLQALYNVGRLVNRRYCKVEFDYKMSFNKKGLSALYNSCVGGAVIIWIEVPRDDEECDIAEGDLSYIEDMCEVIRQYLRDVLTLICLSKGCKRLKERIFENMGNSTFVEISEEVVFDETARDYLKDHAKKSGLSPDKELYSKLEEGHGYLVTDLNGIFDQWYCEKLKTKVYRQYRDIASIKKTVKEKKPIGSAYDELEAMIGLNSAKKVLHQVLDSCKAQKLFREKGMKTENFCNHMIFTGNPGTAKTTMARLFAKILKDNGVLSKGHLVETGRGDIVGMYVGWTAPIIKKKFKEASGGVLFIDEAYSLVDDRDGSYGDEAINTIVQEMENHRNDVMVIFAGYPDKMEQFISKNPGLRSRIAHHVHFDDYDTEELVEIAQLIAEKKGLVLEDDAKEKLRGIMDEARKCPDFGNGRYVRNVIEKAKMAQSVRLVRMDYESVTTDDVKKICAEDIEMPVINSGNVVRKIGFLSA